jgi:hypothetical protein
MSKSNDNFSLLYELYSTEKYTSNSSYTSIKEFIVQEELITVKQEFVPRTIPQNLEER